MQKDMFDSFGVADLAYLAGIVDGEGTVTLLGSQAGALTCRIMVPNTYEPLILWLAETFGGRISHYGKPRSAKHKQVYMWYVSARRAIQLCEAMLPYLRVKRRQAEILIAVSKLRHFYAKGQRGRRVAPDTLIARDLLLSEIRLLNKRGA